MKKKEIIASALLAAAALLAEVGCQKQDGATAGSSVSFSVSVAGQEGAKSAAGVKSVLYNKADDIQTDGNTFVCSAYNTTKGASLFTGETVTYSETSSRWSTEAAYTWYPNEIITFHAVYPATAAGTGDGEAAIASDGTGISISNYAVADNAASQIDLMLGYYSGNGNNSGTAAINFKHPFTAIRFKMGDLAEFIPGFTGINSITISNVYTGGSLALWNGSTFSWTPTSTTKTVTMTVGGAKPEAGEYIVGTDASAEAFTLIPQDLATKTATITVSYNATVNGSIVATISQVSTTSTQWEAGKVYTYTINYKTMPVTISDSVNDWTPDPQGEIEAEEFPNPKYWVDLGFVSANGYPLYFSKRDVADIVNGVATFVEKDTDVGKNFTEQAVPQSVVSEDGLLCTVLSIFDATALFNQENSNFNYGSNYLEVVSKIVSLR